MTWNEFWHSHAGRNYTPVFNSFFDSQIADMKLPLTLRVLAWVLRNAWGRHSDACIDEAGARRTQVDCARELKVFNRKGEPARNKVNRILSKLQAWGLVRVVGWDIFPIDPEQASSLNLRLLSHPNAPIGEDKAKINVDDYCESVWKLEKPSTYGEYQIVAPRYKELRTELVSDCKAYNGMSPRGVTNEENGAAGVPEGCDNLSQRDGTNEPPSLIRTKEHSYDDSAAAFSKVVDDNEPNQNPPPPIDEGKITKALTRYERPDRPTVLELINACRKRDDAATTDEIMELIHQKGKRWKGPGLALFLRTVPPCFPLERGTENPSEALPYYLLPTSVRRLRQQLRDVEAAIAASPEDQALKVELEAVRQRLEFEERDYGNQRKGAASEGSAQAQKAGQA